MVLKRRDFFYGAGVWLAGFSSWQGLLASWSSSAAAALTQRGKRALLVGINHYGPGELLPPLQGCLTDVELQRQFLRYRLGWPGESIRVLTNQRATVAAIQTQIQEFLLAEVTSGDTLLFHFSGYGRHLSGLGPSLIPYDAVADGSQDFPLKILSQIHLPPGVLLWCSFDAGFTIPSGAGNNHRARPPLGENLNPVSLTLPSGMIWLQPTMAKEIHLGTTQAGAFTHTITHHLWTTGATNALAGYGAAQDLERQTGELIHLHWQAGTTTRLPLAPVLTTAESGQGAEAAVMTPNKETTPLPIWLGGVARPLLTQAGWQSYFQPLGEDVHSEGWVLLQNPTGLMATTTAANLTPGTLLQERYRLLPHHVTVTIGLADTLDKVTRIDAVSALDGFADWVSVNTEGGGDFYVVAHSEQGHCLYGLAWPGGILIPHTLGPPGEAIKAAVRRLGAIFPMLLAHKLLLLTLSREVSRLGVTVAWEKVSNQPELLLRVQTGRATAPSTETAVGNFSPQAWERGITLQVGDQFRYRLTNYSPTPIYVLWLAWDSAAGLLILPTLTDAAQPAWQLTLAPQLTVNLPLRELRYPSPCVNSYLIFSRTPFTQAEDYLNRFTSTGDPPLHIPNKQALALVQAILSDLHQTPPPPLPPPSNSYFLDLQAWATFCFTFRVV